MGKERRIRGKGKPVEGLDDIIQEFLVESHENLDQLDRDLVSLEEQPQSRELVSRIFRTIHTIKGTSGFLAFTNLESVTHAGESLLSRLRDGTQPVTADTISTLLAMVDSVRSLLASIEESGGEGEIGIDAVVSMINRQMEPGDATAAAATSAPASALRRRSAPPRRRPRRHRPSRTPTGTRVAGRSASCWSNRAARSRATSPPHCSGRSRATSAGSARS